MAKVGDGGYEELDLSATRGGWVISLREEWAEKLHAVSVPECASRWERGA